MRGRRCGRGSTDIKHQYKSIRMQIEGEINSVEIRRMYNLGHLNGISLPSMIRPGPKAESWDGYRLVDLYLFASDHGPH